MTIFTSVTFQSKNNETTVVKFVGASKDVSEFEKEETIVQHQCYWTDKD